MPILGLVTTACWHLAITHNWTKKGPAMDVTTVFVIMRMFERIAAVVIGGFLVYLGYTLFLKLPELQDAKGSLKLPSNVSVYLSHIGPGAFFALFGSVVIALSIIFGVRFEQRFPAEGMVLISASQDEEKASAQTTPIAEIVISGAGEQVQVTPVDPRKSRDVSRYIFALNQLNQTLASQLSAEERQQYLSDLPEIKLALMETVWDAGQWGDLAAFREWVSAGASEPAPDPSLVTPAAIAFFNNGLSGGP
jgi:branched-subunit amino acid transport protein